MTDVQRIEENNLDPANWLAIGTVVKLKDENYLTRSLYYDEDNRGRHYRICSYPPRSSEYASKFALITDVSDDRQYELYFPHNNDTMAWFDRDQFDTVADLLAEWRAIDHDKQR